MPKTTQETNSTVLINKQQHSFTNEFAYDKRQLVLIQAKRLSYLQFINYSLIGGNFFYRFKPSDSVKYPNAIENSENWSGIYSPEYLEVREKVGRYAPNPNGDEVMDHIFGLGVELGPGFADGANNPAVYLLSTLGIKIIRDNLVDVYIWSELGITPYKNEISEKFHIPEYLKRCLAYLIRKQNFLQNPHLYFDEKYFRFRTVYGLNTNGFTFANPKSIGIWISKDGYSNVQPEWKEPLTLQNDPTDAKSGVNSIFEFN